MISFPGAAHSLRFGMAVFSLLAACQSPPPPSAAAPSPAAPPASAPAPSAEPAPTADDRPQEAPTAENTAAAAAPSASATAEDPSPAQGQGFGSSGKLSTGDGRKVGSLVRVGKITLVEGQEDTEALTRRLNVNKGRYRLCYDAALEKKKELEGRLTLRFKVQADGSVSDVERVATELADTKMIECVIKAVSGIKLDARERGTVVVEAPLMFAPGG